MANFLVGGGNKVNVSVTYVAPGTATPTPGGSTRLLGGTQAGFSISADTTDSTVFEDALGFANGVVTAQSWEVPWTANVLEGDAGKEIVKDAAVNAVGGAKVGITVTVTNGAGTQLSQLVGVAIVTNYSEDYPSDGIITYNCTFTGFGTPTLS